MVSWYTAEDYTDGVFALCKGEEAVRLPLNFNRNILAQCLEHNTMVRYLALRSCRVLRHCSIREEFERDAFFKLAEVLGKILEQNQTLKHIMLDGYRISDKALTSLGANLENNKTLKYLYLRDNTISDPEAIAIGKILENNCSLLLLDLNDNEISDEGAIAIAKALENNKVLTALHVSRNQISVKGAIAIAKALENNKVLTTLRISKNQISDEGLKAFAKLLENNKVLVELDISDNEITNEVTKVLAKALKNNQTLTTLEFQNNKISDEGALALLDVFETNKSLTKCFVWNMCKKLTPEVSNAFIWKTQENVKFKCFQVSATCINFGDFLRSKGFAVNILESIFAMAFTESLVPDHCDYLKYERAKALVSDLLEIRNTGSAASSSSRSNKLKRRVYAFERRRGGL